MIMMRFCSQEWCIVAGGCSSSLLLIMRSRDRHAVQTFNVESHFPRFSWPSVRLFFLSLLFLISSGEDPLFFIASVPQHEKKTKGWDYQRFSWRKKKREDERVRRWKPDFWSLDFSWTWVRVSQCRFHYLDFCCCSPWNLIIFLSLFLSLSSSYLPLRCFSHAVIFFPTFSCLPFSRRSFRFSLSGILHFFLSSVPKLSSDRTLVLISAIHSFSQSSSLFLTWRRESMPLEIAVVLMLLSFSSALSPPVFSCCRLLLIRKIFSFFHSYWITYNSESELLSTPFRLHPHPAWSTVSEICTCMPAVTVFTKAIAEEEDEKREMCDGTTVTNNDGNFRWPFSLLLRLFPLTSQSLILTRVLCHVSCVFSVTFLTSGDAWLSVPTVQEGETFFCCCLTKHQHISWHFCVSGCRLRDSHPSLFARRCCCRHPHRHPLLLVPARHTHTHVPTSRVWCMSRDSRYSFTDSRSLLPSVSPSHTQKITCHTHNYK